MTVPQYSLRNRQSPGAEVPAIVHPCHSEGRSPVGISRAIVRISTAYQEIATACGLAMTTGIRGWCLRIRPKFPRKESAYCGTAIAVPYISISKYSVGNGHRAVPPMPTASEKSLPPGGRVWLRRNSDFFGRLLFCGQCRGSRLGRLRYLQKFLKNQRAGTVARPYKIRRSSII